MQGFQIAAALCTSDPGGPNPLVYIGLTHHRLTYKQKKKCQPIDFDS